MDDGWLAMMCITQVSSQPYREAKNIVRWWHFVRKNKLFCLESLLFGVTRGGRKLSVLLTTRTSLETVRKISSNCYHFPVTVIALIKEGGRPRSYKKQSCKMKRKSVFYYLFVLIPNCPVIFYAGRTNGNVYGCVQVRSPVLLIHVRV